jgi:flagellin
MGLRINTNLSSLMALRTLTINDRKQTQSLERLSTGLRINRGADDPSGLVISEELRGQLGSLQQAVNNSQDASNLISTADAALQEVSTLLVRIRESILFALNTGGASPAQIAAEQDAVDQAIAAIERIAATTRFADRPLLNGTVNFIVTGNRPDLLDDLNVRSAAFVQGEAVRDFSIVVTTNPQRGQIRILSAYADGSTTLRISGPRGTEDVILASGTTSQSIAQAINSVAGFTGIYASGTTGAGHRLDIFTEEFGLGQMVRIEVIDGRISGATTTVQVMGDDGTLTSTGITQKPLDSGDVVMDWGLDGQVLFEGQLFTGVGREFNILTKVANLEFKLDPELIGVQLSATFTLGNTGLDFQLNEMARPTDRLSVGIESVTTALLGFEEHRDRIAESIRGISVGAPSTSWVMTGGFMNSIKTGGKNDLTRNPQNAAEIVRAAVTKVARLRGFLGAIQADTLGPNINALNIAIESTSASLSTIRDLDFARETANFVKAQILFQSSLATLANANTIPQSVLLLLRV